MADASNEDSAFWDRLAGMPWWEAEQECVLRRERITQSNADLQQLLAAATRQDRRTEYGASIACNNAKLTKLGEHIKYLRKLQDRIQWRETVRTLYGDGAVSECLVHMERQYAEINNGRRAMAKRRTDGRKEHVNG